MRDDSALYTGASSASLSPTKEQPLRKAQREDKIEKRSALAPFADIVATEIQKEIEKLRNIDYVEVESMIDDAQFRAEMMARKKTIEKLQGVQMRLNNILRQDGRKAAKPS